MSVTINNVVIYGAANMPEADSVTVGGAVDLTKRVMYSDLPYQGLTGSANSAAMDVVSGTSGDTGVHVLITGRDSTGAIVTPAFVTTTGTTILVASFGGQKFQRLQACVITGGAINTLTNPGGTAAVSDVAVMSPRILASRTCGGSSANTSGVNPPLFSLFSGDGTTVAGLVYQGLGVIIRITSGPGVNQLRMITAPYAAGTAGYGTDLVAINRDWTTIPTIASTYDLAYGFLFDILPNPVVAITRMFVNSASPATGTAGPAVYYEKVFAVNTNGTTSLLTSTVQIFSESGALPSGATLDLATGTGYNDSVTIANRQTLPTGTNGFVVQPSAINFPGTQNLAVGAAGSLALWARLTLNAGTATYQGAADFRIQGNTT